MPPLRRAGHMCRPWCDWRRAAFLGGVFYWDAFAGGYCFTSRDIPRKRDGKPFTFTCCPSCGGDLPDPVDYAEDLLGYRPGEGLT